MNASTNSSSAFTLDSLELKDDTDASATLEVGVGHRVTTGVYYVFDT